MRFPRLIAALLILVVPVSFSPGLGYADLPDSACTGIMGAFSEEVNRLEESLVDAKEQTVVGVLFMTGSLMGRKVAIAPSGVGKVNAAMTATIMIDHFKPSEILFSVIAGAVNPELSPPRHRNCRSPQQAKSVKGLFFHLQYPCRCS